VKKLLFLSILFLLDVQLAEAAEKVVTTTFSAGDARLAYTIIQASKISAKIEEYGVGAVLTLSGGITSFAMGKVLASAYRETRSLAVDAIGRITRTAVLGGAGALAGAGLAEGVEKLAGGIGKGAEAVGKGIKKAVGKLKPTKKISPTDVRTPFDGFSPLSTGGVGVGRAVSPADVVNGKIGSSAINKLSSPEGELVRKEDKWFDVKGQEVTQDKLSEFLSSSAHLKAELEDGTTSYLTKSGDVFRERVGTDVLSSPEKLQHRLSRDEVVVDYNKLSGKGIAEIVNSLPEGAKVSIIGPVVKNEKGVMEYKRLAFKKTENGFKLYDNFGIGKTKQVQDRFKDLNSNKQFQQSKKVDADFFNGLFNDEDEDVR